MKQLTLREQQRAALDEIEAKLTESAAKAYSLGIDSVGNAITQAIRFTAETQRKVALDIRRQEVDGRREIADEKPCPSCGGPNDHGEECAKIYPEIYGRKRPIQDHAMDPRD